MPKYLLGGLIYDIGYCWRLKNINILKGTVLIVMIIFTYKVKKYAKRNLEDATELFK